MIRIGWIYNFEANPLSRSVCERPLVTSPPDTWVHVLDSFLFAGTEPLDYDPVNPSLSTTCPDCQGTGFVCELKCETCGARGIVEVVWN